ncbi:MAG: zinc ABC transporter permease AztB [Ilumatobacteraceae bacterium]
MHWFTAVFEPAFMQRALFAGMIASVAGGLVGTWVVARGLSFLGDALAHGVLPGLALATLWGFDPIIGALVAAFVMSGAVTVIGDRSQLRDDTAIGLLFVGMLALGVIIVSRSDRFATDLTALLFGEILGVTARDLTEQAIAAGLIVVATIVLYRPFLAVAFNRDKSMTLGMRPTLAHAALLAVLSVAIVASFRAVGTLLVFGLLIAPAATASLVVRRIPVAMVVSVALGWLSVVMGLVVSYHASTAAGATIAAVSVGWFFVVLALRPPLIALRRDRAVAAV